MVVLPRYNWLRLLFVWQGSVLPRILPRLLIVFLLSLLSAAIQHWWVSQHADSSLNAGIFTLLGVSLAIFLGFRNSVSYDRFWEARKLWGQLLIVNRSLTGKLSAVDDTAAPAMINTMLAINYALKGFLRDDNVQTHLERLLGSHAASLLSGKQHLPSRLLGRLHAENHGLRQRGSISENQWLDISRNLDDISEAVGGCERISSTPIPYTYRVMLNRTVTLYCLLLPLGLVTSIGWLTPVIAVFVAYTYLALDSLGDELEEPFGKEGNDLPLAAICYGIERMVREMRDEEITAPPPARDGIYQF